MKYAKINSSLFIKNRSKLVSHLKPGSIALFHSNDEMLKTGDASFKFRQNSDLFYLTGVDQEDSILVVFPDCPNPAFREVLFIKRTNETIVYVSTYTLLYPPFMCTGNRNHHRP